MYVFDVRVLEDGGKKKYWKSLLTSVHWIPESILINGVYRKRHISRYARTQMNNMRCPTPESYFLSFVVCTQNVSIGREVVDIRQVNKWRILWIKYGLLAANHHALYWSIWWKHLIWIGSRHVLLKNKFAFSYTNSNIMIWSLRGGQKSITIIVIIIRAIK